MHGWINSNINFWVQKNPLLKKEKKPTQPPISALTHCPVPIKRAWDQYATGWMAYPSIAFIVTKLRMMKEVKNNEKDYSVKRAKGGRDIITLLTKTLTNNKEKAKLFNWRLVAQSSLKGGFVFHQAIMRSKIKEVEQRLRLIQAWSMSTEFEQVQLSKADELYAWDTEGTCRHFKSTFIFEKFSKVSEITFKKKDQGNYRPNWQQNLKQITQKFASTLKTMQYLPE